MEVAVDLALVNSSLRSDHNCYGAPLACNVFRTLRGPSKVVVRFIRVVPEVTKGAAVPNGKHFQA